jgi:hypothetical protein
MRDKTIKYIIVHHRRQGQDKIVLENIGYIELSQLKIRQEEVYHARIVQYMKG